MLLSSSAVLAQAQALSPDEHFQSGRRAYEAQNYAAALQAFEAALAAGQSGPAIHFNIGVAAYRAGAYERAADAFTEVARTPSMAALAHYNLGLVDLKRGRTAEASRWFTRAQAQAGEERLRELARIQLAQLSAVQEERNWVAFVSTGMGYDDNVALVASDTVLDVSDTADEFAEATLAVSGPLDRAWYFDASLIATKYRELDDFDQLVAQGGAHYRFELASWTYTASAELAHTQLGGDGFENRVLFGVRAVKSLPQDWALRLRYRYSDLDGLSEFDALDGSRHEAQAQLRRRRGAWEYHLDYGYESSSYRDEALTVRQHLIAVACERELQRGWRVGLDAAQRFSNYALDTHGTEDRIELGASVQKQVSEHWRLGTRYEYANNDAKLAEFDYGRKRIWVGAQAAFY